MNFFNYNETRGGNITKISKEISRNILVIICILVLATLSLNASFATTANVDNSTSGGCIQQGLNNLNNYGTMVLVPENYTDNNKILENYTDNNKISLNFNKEFQSKNSDSKRITTFNISSKIYKARTYKTTPNSTEESEKFSTSDNTRFDVERKSTIQANSEVLSTDSKSVKASKSNNENTKCTKNTSYTTSKNTKIVKIYSNSKDRKIKIYSIVKNKKGKLVKKVSLVSKRKITEAYVIKKSFASMDAIIETTYYSRSEKGFDHSNKTKFNSSTKLNKVIGLTGTWVKVTPDNYLMCRWFQQRTYTVAYKKGDCTYKTYTNGKLTKITKKKGINYVVKSKTKNMQIKNPITSTQMLTNQNLSSTLDCNVDNPKIKKQIKVIYKGLSDNEKKSEVAVSNAIFKWMSKNIKYDYTDLLRGSKPNKAYYSGTRLGSDKMIDKKMGNCLDHSHLAAAMFRIAGIPAGYEYKYRADGYAHVWNRIFINKKWIAVDTVIKNENKIRGRSEWVNGKIMNNDAANYHLLTFNYCYHKTTNYKNVSWDYFWCIIENQTIYWEDGKVEQIYWKSIYEK